MANFVVVYDACVLYPASIRDLVVELARTGLLRAKWTTRIHAEWINAGIRAIHPDEFVEHMLDLNAEAVCEAVRRIRRRLVNPPRSADEMIQNYERNGLAVSASILRARAKSL